jgi:hypothetical protein
MRLLRAGAAAHPHHARMNGEIHYQIHVLFSCLRLLAACLADSIVRCGGNFEVGHILQYYNRFGALF